MSLSSTLTVVKGVSSSVLPESGTAIGVAAQAGTWPTTAVKKVRRFRGHGTKVFFRPDDTIFRRIHFNSETMLQHL